MTAVPDLASRVREAALLEGDFVLSSGKRSSFYVDKYLFSTEPGLLRELATELSRLLPDNVDRLAGVELGAVPLATAVSLVSGLPYVIVRKVPKEYGGSAGESIEGKLGGGERVVLIEDVITTGAQALVAAGRLSEARVEVVKIVAVLDRREDRSGSLDSFPFEALFGIDELRPGGAD